jgi:hypothetical protein
MSRPAPQQQGRGGDRFENYVPVAERLEKFYEKYPEGRVTTSVERLDLDTGFVLMRAEIYRTPEDASPAATGHAFEVRGDSYVNKTSFVENCETSAVGRGLALLGFEIKRGLVSREEAQRAERPNLQPVPPRGAHQPAAGDDLRAEVVRLCNELGYDEKMRAACLKRFDALPAQGGKRGHAVESLKNLLAKQQRQSGEHAARTERQRLIRAHFESEGMKDTDIARYLKRKHKGMALEEMSLAELGAMCEDLGVELAEGD